LFFGQNFTLAKNGDFAGIHDDERLEVQDALEVAHGNVQQIADAARQALEEPDVRAGRSQLDVAEALAADFAERYFDAAFVANHAAVLHALVLAAQTFPVGDGAENLRAKQAVTLRLERAVVDGFRLGDFAVGPRTNFFRTCQTDADGIEIGNQAGAIIGAAAIQGCFLPPRLSPGPRPGSHLSGCSPRTAENPTTKTADKTRLPIWGATCCAPTKAIFSSPRPSPRAASAASSTRRRDRATATRAPAR